MRKSEEFKRHSGCPYTPDIEYSPKTLLPRYPRASQPAFSWLHRKQDTRVMRLAVATPVPQKLAPKVVH